MRRRVVRTGAEAGVGRCGGGGKHTPIKRCTRVAEGRVLELGGNNSLRERWGGGEHTQRGVGRTMSTVAEGGKVFAGRSWDTSS